MGGKALVQEKRNPSQMWCAKFDGNPWPNTGFMAGFVVRGLKIGQTTVRYLKVAYSSFWAKNLFVADPIETRC